MRFITQHSQHIYKSKSSAMRAGRNAIGDKYLVEAPELGSRFDGCITISADMVSVEPCADGWRWSYTFDIDAVIVKVRNVDGTIGEARYADVAHWRDACTPNDGAACKVARQVYEYLCARDTENTEGRIALYEATMPGLIAMCQEADIDVHNLFSVCFSVKEALVSTSPHYIAEIILRAEPFGLVTGALRAHLEYWARKRGCHGTTYLRLAEEALSEQAA